MDMQAFSLHTIPVLLLLIALEMLWYRLKGKTYPLKEAGASFLVFLGRLPVKTVLFLLTGAIYAFAWQFRIATIPMRSPWSGVLLFFAFEFSYYWYHRLSHQVRWLWAEHSVHHSPNSITFAGAYRLGWTGFLAGVWIFWLPLVLIGFPPQAVFTILSLNLLYQFWLHTELIPKLGPLEWVLNTPSHHRAHHASNRRYLDSNFGGVLIIYDRLFGTFVEESSDEPCRYGTVPAVKTLNPLRIVFDETWKLIQDVAKSKTWEERLFCLFGAPGKKLVIRTRFTTQEPVSPAVPERNAVPLQSRF